MSFFTSGRGSDSSANATEQIIPRPQPKSYSNVGSSSLHNVEDKLRLGSFPEVIMSIPSEDRYGDLSRGSTDNQLKWDPYRSVIEEKEDVIRTPDYVITTPSEDRADNKEITTGLFDVNSRGDDVLEEVKDTVVRTTVKGRRSKKKLQKTVDINSRGHDVIKEVKKSKVLNIGTTDIYRSQKTGILTDISRRNKKKLPKTGDVNSRGDGVIKSGRKKIKLQKTVDVNSRGDGVIKCRRKKIKLQKTVDVNSRGDGVIKSRRSKKKLQKTIDVNSRGDDAIKEVKERVIKTSRRNKKKLQKAGDDNSRGDDVIKEVKERVIKTPNKRKLQKNADVNSRRDEIVEAKERVIKISNGSETNNNNQALKKDIWIKHYCSCHKILIVGDGDFSFSACLAKAFGSADSMVATSLNSLGFLMHNYKKAYSNIKDLKGRGCMVIHGLDATTMADHDYVKGARFDRIIYNFPLAGFFGGKLPREEELRRNQTLVELFLKNAKKMISKDGEVHISHKCSPRFYEWNLKSLAKKSGFKQIEEVVFEVSDYPGYRTKYGFGGDKNFDCSPSRTYKFGLKQKEKKRI